MKPIINPWLFYLIDVLQKFNTIIMAVLIMLGIIIAIIVLFWFSDGEWKDDDERHKFLTITWKMIVAGCVIALVHAAIPSKETMYTMLVANYTTYDNVEKASNVIKDSVDYIFDKIDGEKSND